MRNSFLAVLLCLVSAVTLADEGKLDLQHQAFHEQSRQIRMDLADGATYSEISADDRHRVIELLDRIGRRLDRAGADSVDALPEHHRVDIFNDQEQVNVILTKASEDSRMICRRERVTGTRRITNVCMTVAERQGARDQGLEVLRSQPSPTMWGN